MKVLVIAANAFSKVLNNGKTLEAMFSEFKPSELCQLFTRPQDSEYTDYNFCSSYYSVSEVDIINKLTFRRSSCGNIIYGNDINHQSKVYRQFKKSKIKYSVIIRDLLWSIGTWRTKQLQEWLKEQKPDIIFVTGGGAKYLHSLAKYANKITGAPIAVFYTDDYLIYPLKKGIIDKVTRRLMARHYKDIIQSASICFCIGSLMAKEYSNFFRKEFYTIMNSIDIPEYITQQKVERLNVVSYFGGLHLNRWKMIAKIAENLPPNTVLRVYTSTEITSEIGNTFNAAKVNLMGCIIGEELSKAMSSSDILLHVESDDENTRALTRLSVSTKIPEYLSTGRPIIGFGPTEVASIRLLSDNKIGLVIDSSSSDNDISCTLASFIADTPRQKSIGLAGRQYAKIHFNKKAIASEFRGLLETACMQNRNRSILYHDTK